jgi:pimeloyl-ACP methyl ester carboxylesterase
MQSTKHIHAGVLNISYVELGPESGPPVVLMHGFPYDIEAYAEVAPLIAAAGCRVIVPYLRGFGETKFLDPETPRSGEQAALGADLLALLSALSIPKAILAGYDWGGRAACVVAALWPERCKGLVSFNSYNIQNIAQSLLPDTPMNEHRLWYQYYFHSERGRNGLEKNRSSLIRLLWELWSPTWRFNDKAFEKSCPSFDNSDFVDVVIHSYRHRYGLVQGDPAYADIEARLALQPKITVPTITFDGADDGIREPSSTDKDSHLFLNSRSHRIVPGVGHNMPQESPGIFADAILELVRATK